MGAKAREVFAFTWSAAVVAAIVVAAVLVSRPATANAQPVEYVKICSLYGSGFFYLPGTDTCVNFTTNDAREETEGGVWRWIVPNNPRTWTPIPQTACGLGGQLVKFGDITGSNLVLNSYDQYETTTHYPLKLLPGQYISSVVYKGGFTNTDRNNQGNFCMFYYYNDPTNGPAYFPFGCIDTSAQAAVPEALSFVPQSPIPPATPNPVFILGANGSRWNDITSPSDVQGKLSVWLCLQYAPVLPGLGF
jgi:hypothetical protein